VNPAMRDIHHMGPSAPAFLYSNYCFQSQFIFRFPISDLNTWDSIPVYLSDRLWERFPIGHGKNGKSRYSGFQLGVDTVVCYY